VGGVDVDVVEVEVVVVGGSSVDVPMVAEVDVLDVGGVVADVAVPVAAVVVLDVFPAPVAAVVAPDVVPAPVAAVVVPDVVAAPVAVVVAAVVVALVVELVEPVDVPPQAVSAAVITAQQESRRRVSILFRTVTPRRTARKFELCEMYSGLKNDGQHVSQRRLDASQACAVHVKPLFLRHKTFTVIFS